MTCKECAAKDETILRLKAELAVRTFYPGFPSRPEKWRGHFSAAYDDGHQNGWLGRPSKNPYTSWKHKLAYADGNVNGAQEASDEIERTLKLLKEEAKT